MSRMLELVRTSQLSSHQMMSASKGALRVPTAEMVEILVYIAEHNKIFRETARMTLAGWDEASAKQIAADPDTPREVLDYWASPQNLRPALLPILIENPSVRATKISELAATLKNELADVLIASPRVQNSPQILHDFNQNHALSGAQAARVRLLMNGDSAETAEPAQSQAAIPEGTLVAADASTSEPQISVESQAKAAISAEQGLPALESAPAEASTKEEGIGVSPEGNSETEIAVAEYLTQHANEIAAEGNKPFQPIGGVFDIAAVGESVPAKALAAAAGASAPGTVTIAPATPVSGMTAPAASPQPAATHKPMVNPEDEKRGSTLQKITALDIKGRIQLAMKGTKEERSILIRDGTKIIALAVLESPKISDGEVEKFASQKNVLEAVLRAIPMKRRFAKNYAVLRNLVFNPRTPLDVALGLVKNLLVGDLRNLSGNKEVSETVRKMALRMFRQKSEAANKT